MESGMDLSALPEGCIATILSLTSPEDACRLSLLCKPFLSAATSDAVWGAFLPADIVSSYLAAGLGSKRELYFRLCDFPLLIDGNKMSFSLERRSGKKCYMLSARALSIIWARGDTPQYWTWGPPPEFFSPNAFQEVACLRLVWWFEINGEINTRMLSPKTNYAAYFVFKWCSNFFGFNSCPLVVYIGVTGGEKTVRCIDFNPVKYSRITPQNDLEYPVDGITMGTERADGWTEIEIGEFFNLGDEDFNLEISLQEMSNKQKRGLLVQGIEVRPKRG